MLCVQTYARLASQYGADDIMTPLEELEDFRKDMEPTLLEKQSKLRSLATDLQVCVVVFMSTSCTRLQSATCCKRGPWHNVATCLTERVFRSTADTMLPHSAVRVVCRVPE